MCHVLASFRKMRWKRKSGNTKKNPFLTEKKKEKKTKQIDGRRVKPPLHSKREKEKKHGWSGKATAADPHSVGSNRAARVECAGLFLCRSYNHITGTWFFFFKLDIEHTKTKRGEREKTFPRSAVVVRRSESLFCFLLFIVCKFVSTVCPSSVG
jgi:hypothetical protein